MRFLPTFAIYSVLTVSSFAQAPQELTGNAAIRLHPGESKLLTTGMPYSKFHLTDDGVVQLVVDTDQTFVPRALKPGKVLMSIYGDGGRLMHRSDVIVAGGLVRIYGTGNADERKTDYIGYICSEVGCGRADPEIERPETQTSVTRRNSRGDLITTTKGRN